MDMPKLANPMPTPCQPSANYNYSSFSSFDGLGPYAILPIIPPILNALGGYAHASQPYANPMPTLCKLQLLKF